MRNNNIEGLHKGIFYRFINSNKKYTLLFLHGFTGSSFIWDEQIESLSKKYNLLLIDLFGHGKSETPKKIEDYFFKNQSKIIVEIINKLGIDFLAITCYSYSVYIGLDIQNLISRKIKSMIFISPYFKEGNNFFERQVLKMIKFLWRYLVPNKKHLLDYSKLENYETPTFKDKKYTLKSINTKDILGSIYALSKQKMLLKNKKVNIPVLVIYGENDKMFSDEIKQKFNDYKITKYKKMIGKKHLFLKTKSEEINKDIINFLSNSLK
ncbi:MAG: alpha/beta fold hydrolase [Nanoarchaeota archaeon]